jgi:hypothetical protein
MRYAAAGASDCRSGVYQERLRSQKVLCDLDGKVRAVHLDQCPFVAPLPQHIGRRTPSRETHETPAVRWKPIDEEIRLTLRIQPTIAEHREQLLGVVCEVVLRIDRTRATPDIAERPEPAT